MDDSNGRKVVTVSALGASIAIHLPDDAPEEVVDRVRAAWQGAAIEVVEPDHVVPVESVDNVESMMEVLSVQVTLRALTHGRGSLLMFHAAGVADEAGRVAAFVGPSGRGKTTLSRALGPYYSYVSDETVAIDPSLRVFPYRKPLSLVREGEPKDQVAPATAGLSELSDAPLELVTLVLLNRTEDAVVPSVEPVGFVQAISDLVPQMSYLSSLERPLRTFVRLVESVGGVRRLNYAESDDLPSIVGELLRGTTTASVEWEDATNAPLPDGVIDALIIDGDLVVLSENVVRVLGGIAPEVWIRHVEGASTETIVDAVVEIFGAPPQGDAAELVERAIAELEAAGLLSQRGEPSAS